MFLEDLINHLGYSLDSYPQPTTVYSQHHPLSFPVLVRNANDNTSFKNLTHIVINIRDGVNYNGKNLLRERVVG